MLLLHLHHSHKLGFAELANKTKISFNYHNNGLSLSMLNIQYRSVESSVTFVTQELRLTEELS